MMRDTDDWYYPQVYEYKAHFDRALSEIDSDIGICPYCREHHFLVEDAHCVLSCLNCLQLDHYLIDNQRRFNYD